MFNAVSLTVLAYAVFSYSIFILAFFHQLTKGPIVVALVASGLIVFLTRKNFSTKLASPISKAERRLFLGFSFLVFCLYAHVLFLPPFVVDDLVYHLLVPKQMLVRNSLYLSAFNLNSNFPMLYEFPLVLSEAFSVSPYLVNIFILLGLLGVMFAVGRTFYHVRPIVLITALTAIVLTPLVYDAMHSSYVELFLTLVLFIAVFYYLSFSETREEKLWYLTCLFLGLACSVKYTAGIAVLLVLIREFFAKTSARTFYQGVLLLVVVAAPWYLKNFLFTGNPTFPMFSWLFDTESVSPLRHLYYQSMLTSYNYGKDVVDYLALPFKILLAWNETPVSGQMGFGGQLSAFFILAAFGLSLKKEHLRTTTYLAVGFFLVWAAYSQQTRFLFSYLMFPLLVGLAWISGKWQARRWFYFLIFALAMGQNIYNLSVKLEKEKIWPLLTGALSKEAFLQDELPISYLFATKVNQILDKDHDRILSVGNFGRSYYFAADVVSNTYYEAEIFDQTFALKEPRTSALNDFVVKEGISHILFDWRFYLNYQGEGRDVDLTALKHFFAKHTDTVLTQNEVVLYKLK